jgi:hypothetical protein
MRSSVLSVLAGTVAALLVSTAALAHHGGASLYDMKKEATLKATITEFVWTNPHVEVGIETADKGPIGRWLLELGSPANIVKRGWSRKSLKPGDVVTITFHPGRHGAKIGWLMKVVTADGKELVG